MAAWLPRCGPARIAVWLAACVAVWLACTQVARREAGLADVVVQALRQISRVALVAHRPACVATLHASGAACAALWLTARGRAVAAFCQPCSVTARRDAWVAADVVARQALRRRVLWLACVAVRLSSQALSTRAALPTLVSLPPRACGRPREGVLAWPRIAVH